MGAWSPTLAPHLSSVNMVACLQLEIFQSMFSKTFSNLQTMCLIIWGKSYLFLSPLPLWLKYINHFQNFFIRIINQTIWFSDSPHVTKDRPSLLKSHRIESIAFQCIFLAATKQLYKWYFPSVCPSVRLSVCPSFCHTFLTMFPSSYHYEIFRSYYQWLK